MDNRALQKLSASMRAMVATAFRQCCWLLSIPSLSVCRWIAVAEVALYHGNLKLFHATKYGIPGPYVDFHSFRWR